MRCPAEDSHKHSQRPLQTQGLWSSTCQSELQASLIPILKNSRPPNDPSKPLLITLHTQLSWVGDRTPDHRMVPDALTNGAVQVESEVNAVSSSSGTATPHSLVSEDHVRAALSADKGAAARLTAWKMVDFTKKGDNYACVVSSVHVEYVLDGRSSEVVYVVKLNSCKRFEDSDSFNTIIFENEAKFYMNLVPELNSIMKDIGHREINFPKCFYASLEHEREVIFLEDLRPRGYKMLDRRRGLDEAHATLVVRELARLHAASLLLQNKTPDHDLKEKHPFLEKGWYYFVRNFDIMLKIMQDSVKFAKEILNKVGGYDRVTTWIDTILPKLVEIFYEQLECGEPKVVCHGDCWNNNLLFRYNEAGQPEDVMLIDLQAVCHAAPVTDLNYLFFTSMTGDVRRPNTKVFLGSYYSTLRSIMEDAGQEVPFTQAQLLLDFRDKNLIGMIFAMMAVPAVLFESEDPVDSSENFNTTGLICLMQAHFMNSVNPGTFQETLAECLALNGLPNVKLPPNPPSERIIQKITGGRGLTPVAMSSPTRQVPVPVEHVASPAPSTPRISVDTAPTQVDPVDPAPGEEANDEASNTSQAAATTTTSNVDVLSVSHEGDASQSAPAVELAPSGSAEGTLSRAASPAELAPAGSMEGILSRAASPAELAPAGSEEEAPHEINKGPLTTSDHIPIILDISTSPIPIPVPKSFAFNRTDWDAFDGDESLQMADLPDVSRATLDDIDAALDSWMSTVKLAADRHIPKTAHKTPAYCTPSRLTQMTRIQFQALRAQAGRAGWTYDNYRRYIHLRLTLQDARRVESRQSWGSALARLSASHRDPKVFWRAVKRLSGRATNKDTYLVDTNGLKHHSDVDKARLHTSVWETVYRDDFDDDDNDIRLLCDFLEDRTARIKVGTQVGPTFPLETGVPQGSVLSPTLYVLYTSDCPSSVAGMNVLYADDVSQVVFHPGRSSAMLNARTEREVARISAFEEEWRIKTNLAKFSVIPMATQNPPPLMVDGRVVDFQASGTVLGLQVSSRGYVSHVTSRVRRAKSALFTLYRFRDLDAGLKLHLVKALVLPVLTYPPIPLHALSRTAISKLQRVQNAALRFVVNHRWDDFVTMESLHESVDLPAINVRLHHMASQVWLRMQEEDWEQFLVLQELSDAAPDRSHGWFPRSLRALRDDPDPAPRYS
ncbi:RNA-directed DNA polymerase from mobile element jockey [Chionoecetes opilio]|uniref:RNA-directed DNA polymerase from mobile element jockey n=1 Tax=Chionoecetes opilio TaxID=41210 RepID=A0A8J4YIX4_CHIOP|nr:RNA-directed DNA polymerase from mobile element jockey [Chionoecetes opilio]